MRAAVKAERAEAVAREHERQAGNRMAEPPRRVPPSMSAASSKAGPQKAPRATETNGERTAASAGARAAAGPEPVVRRSRANRDTGPGALGHHQRDGHRANLGGEPAARRIDVVTTMTSRGCNSYPVPSACPDMARGCLRTER